MKALSKIQSGVALVALFLLIAISGCNNAPKNDKNANEQNPGMNQMM